MKSLRKISESQNPKDQTHIKKIVKSFPRTFRVNPAFPEEGVQTVFIEPGFTINHQNLQDG